MFKVSMHFLLINDQNVYFRGMRLVQVCQMLHHPRNTCLNKVESAKFLRVFHCG